MGEQISYLFILSWVILTPESVDENLWCDHSNETSSAVLSHGTIYIYKMKFEIFLNFDFRHSWE